MTMNNHFNGMMEESQRQSQQAIFESMASLDDNNLQECFGLDIESAIASEHAAALERIAINHEIAMLRKEPSMVASQPAAHLVSPPSVERRVLCESPSLQSVSSHCTSYSASANEANASSTGSDPNEEGKPKRPLSAYNLFFQLERERLIAGTAHTEFTALDVERVADARRVSDLQTDKPKRKHRKSHGKITFAELARCIANKWKILTDQQKDLLLERAGLEKARYLRELEEWTKLNESEKNYDASESSVASLTQEKSDPSLDLPESDPSSGTYEADEQMASLIPNEVDFSTISSMSSIQQSSKGVPAWQHQRQLSHQVNLQGHSRGPGNANGTSNDRLVSPSGSLFHETRSFPPMSKRVRFVPNLDPMRTAEPSSAASMAVHEAVRVARKSGMNASNILKMFEQMAVQEGSNFPHGMSTSRMMQQNRHSFPSKNDIYTPPLRNPAYDQLLFQEQQDSLLRAQMQNRQQQQQLLQLQQQMHQRQHQQQHQQQQSFPFHQSHPSLPFQQRFQHRSNATHTLHDLAEAASSDAASMIYDEDRLSNVQLASSYADDLKRMGRL